MHLAICLLDTSDKKPRLAVGRLGKGCHLLLSGAVKRQFCDRVVIRVRNVRDPRVRSSVAVIGDPHVKHNKGHVGNDLLSLIR